MTLALVSSKLFISSCSFHYDPQVHLERPLRARVPGLGVKLGIGFQVTLAHKGPLLTTVKVKVKIKAKATLWSSLM